MSKAPIGRPPASAAGSRRSALVACFFHWFSELEAQGEEAFFRIGRVSGAAAEPTWTRLPHHTFDGLGGLSHVLAERYGRTLELPLLAKPYPGLLRRWLVALRLLLTPAQEPLAWKPQGLAEPGAAPTAVWALVSESETLGLRERARSLGVSLNALLLWGLTSAVRPLISAGPGVIEWIVPVNMRGAEPTLPPTGNQAATLDVCIPADATARVIDARIREQLQNDVHWAVWQLLKWLGAAGPRLIRAQARRELAVRKHGSFSNLGNLRVARDNGTAATEPEWWLAMNPVQRTRPIGAACLTYEGRLALTLQVHAALGLTPAATQQLLDDWLSALGLAQPPNAARKSTAGITTL